MANPNLLLKNVRLAYPNLFEPKENTLNSNHKLEYSVQIVIQEADPQVKVVENYMKEIYETKFGDAVKAKKAMDRAADSRNTRFFHHNVNGHYYYLNAKRPGGPNDPKPRLFDTDKRLLDPNKPADRAKIYGGCFADVLINGYIYQHANVGMSAQLLGVRWRGDGEPFVVTKQASAEDFPDLADTGDKKKDEDEVTADSFI